MRERSSALGQARAGMDRMSNEIKLIPDTDQITTTNASSLTYQYPVGTSITYSLNGFDTN